MSAGSFQDLLTAWGKNESGNNYSFVSSLGFLGRYQFSEEGLMAIGWYSGDDNPHNMDFRASWTAKAASYGVTDKWSFLSSTAAQDAACMQWFDYLVADIQRLGLTQYLGQTLNGVPITMSGMLTGGSLVGVWALKRYLESGATHGGTDWYGTNVAEYVTRFAGYETPYNHLGPHAAPASPQGLNGDGGHNYLQGGDAGETIDGGPGNDTLMGGGGDDHLRGGPGVNYLRGESGNDIIEGGDEFDDAHGNEGNDTVHGRGGDDWVVGGKDQDRLYGDDGDDVVLGNMGNDTVEGGSGNDVVRGGQGDDLVYGQDGDDWLSGDRGADTLWGGSGADTFHAFADSGVDRVMDFNAGEGDRVFLLPGTSYNAWQSGTDTIVDMGGGNQLVLVNVNLGGLPPGWIF